MASPFNVKRNNYKDNPKRSDIVTPIPLAEYVYDILYDYFEATQPVDKPVVVLDPACGRGNLLQPFMQGKGNILWEVYGIDVKDYSSYIPNFHMNAFESILKYPFPKPDMVVMNPPFNACSGKKLYPEVFLKHVEFLFGNEIPVVMFTPMGFRLNQRMKSSRFRYVRDRWNQTASIALPLDVFIADDGELVEFQAEVLIFNLPLPCEHYYLEDKVIDAIQQLRSL